MSTKEYREIDSKIFTDRFIMRKFEEKDIKKLYEIVKKKEVGEWLGKGKGMSFKEAKDYLDRILSHWSTYNFGVWAILNLSNNEIMGHCGFRHIDNTGDIEIIYLLDPKYWGLGIATEAGKIAIKHTFPVLNVHKLTARIRFNNSKSKDVIGKLGFKFIGDKIYNGRMLSYYELDKPAN